VTLAEGSAVPVRRPRRVPDHVIDDETHARLSTLFSAIRKQTEAIALPNGLFVRKTESLQRQCESSQRLAREISRQLEPMRQQLESMRRIGRQLERQVEAARNVTRAFDSHAVRAALRATRVPVCSWRRPSRRPPPRARTRRCGIRRVGGRRAGRGPRKPEPEPDELSRARRGWSS
jgi:hypothetical protein